jgi:hypothetical protein
MVNLDGMRVIYGRIEKTKNYKYHRKKDIFPYEMIVLQGESKCHLVLAPVLL